MTCRDCFGFSDCLDYESTPYYGLDCACNNVEELCENFKNKADFVEVVRCKDCKYYVSNYCTRDIKGRTNMFYMQPTDFCSYGERRDT